MRLIPTFCDGHFHGYDNLREINRLRLEAHEMALVKQETTQADHMVYGFYTLDEDGNIVTARLYSGVAKTEEEFGKIAEIPKAHIYAIHKHK